MLGTVRMAVSAARGEDDVEFRDSLLESAEAEIARLVGLVSALPLLDGPESSEETMPTAELVALAAEQARRRGVAVRLETSEVEDLRCLPLLGRVIGALAVMAASGDGPVPLIIDRGADQRSLRVRILGLPIPDDAVVRALLARAGATRLGPADNLGAAPSLATKA